MTIDTGGQVNQIRFDGNPNQIKYPLSQQSVQWFGRHPHQEAANWGFYDNSVRRIDYPSVKDDERLWNFFEN